jgi:PAS domain S-box-containing protein
VRATPHYGAAQKITRLLGTVADISARKKAEEDALATAAKFEMFAQTMPSMVWTSLPDGRIEWFNARVPEYTGVDAAALKPDGLTPVHPDDVETATRDWLEAVATGNPFTTEYRIRRHDGEYRWHITRAVPIRDAGGAIIRWIGTSADIQDQKNTENRAGGAERDSGAAGGGAHRRADGRRGVAAAVPEDGGGGPADRRAGA